MRFVIAVLLLALAVLRPVAAEEPADSIEAVIGSQIAAFQRNDLAEAFGHAAPGIQAIFRTPEMFGRMVETGYPMVWRPARYQMLGLAETPEGLVQTVLFEDRSGRLHEAAYLMQEVDGVWRIAGVSLSVLPGIGA
jgi:hypothetical protein